MLLLPLDCAPSGTQQHGHFGGGWGHLRGKLAAAAGNGVLQEGPGVRAGKRGRNGRHRPCAQRVCFALGEVATPIPISHPLLFSVRSVCRLTTRNSTFVWTLETFTLSLLPLFWFVGNPYL